MKRDIPDLLRRGLMIEAVKEYRDEHGCGLLEAMDAVRAIAAGLGIDIDVAIESRASHH
jgi:ribosomal protein L7/L12